VSAKGRSAGMTAGGRRAASYDRLNERLNRAGLDRWRDRLVGGLTGDVLEIGAGTGLNLHRYPAAARLTALEPDADYADRLRERAAELGRTATVVDGVAEAIPLPAASFDHVVVSLVLCTVPDPEGALREIARVLRPGGSLAFLEHVRDEGRLGRWQDRLTWLQRLLAGGCRLNRDPVDAIGRAGLRIERLERFTMPPGHPLLRSAVQGRALR
jgi:ubiquinone/menaquinone biosynthesis C-methylase UbiE